MMIRLELTHNNHVLPYFIDQEDITLITMPDTPITDHAITSTMHPETTSNKIGEETPDLHTNLDLT